MKLDLAKWLERSFPASCDRVDSEGRQMKQFLIMYCRDQANNTQQYILRDVLSRSANNRLTKILIRK
jgi:hypothetical protein